MRSAQRSSGRPSAHPPQSSLGGENEGERGRREREKKREREKRERERRGEMERMQVGRETNRKIVRIATE